MLDPSDDSRPGSRRLELTARRQSGSQAVVQALVDRDVTMFFLCSGGALIAPLCEALGARAGVRVVRLSQERAAVHAAEGYAKATGQMAAVLVSGGPGVAAAVAGLMSSMADSVPVLCLAGQVDSALIGTDAFRECDALGITRSVTKWSRRIDLAHDAADIVDRAVQIARNGRCGPVLLEVPIDVQRTQVPVRRPAAGGAAAMAARSGSRAGQVPRSPPDRRLVHSVAQIRAARRPVLYAGGGVIRSGVAASEALAAFAQVADLPCVLTMSALGALPSADRRCLGCLGEQGSPVANLALRNADLVICVGTRLDERSWPRGESLPGALIHVDIDPTSINKICPAATPLVGDCAEVLKGLGQHWLQAPGFGAATDDGAAARLQPWWQAIDGWRHEATPADAPQPRAPIADQVLRALREPLASLDAVVTVDDGLAQGAGARHLQHRLPGRWLVSAGVGMPGFALPAAVGVLAAQPRRPVVCLSDANALLPTLHELQSVYDHGWPLKLIVFPPPVADLRRSAAACAASPSVMIQRPDIAAVARAFGWRIHRLKSAAAIERAIAECLASDEPYLLQVDLSLADPLRFEPVDGPAVEPVAGPAVDPAVEPAVEQGRTRPALARER
ncbi:MULTISPECIES: thiamine pyrophosphate-binding protein [unclassified Rhizobacter]|uniref:thiamine pyrophosphate-binding protein n=1 Tax=unclassified Rhizobacter TaxID=2640088 RepID=UPI00138F79C2|nr:MULTISPECIES: thiamine pyrophosphate-binding protein [unclassified Rhizobacter]